MNKVYFDSEKKVWFVNEPEDFYSFKSINYETNEENKNILSWTRGVDLKDYPNHIRMYDVEIDDVKYFFLMRKEGTYYVIESENPIELENLINNHNILFVGETMNI
jgi:hypothetical protein